MKQFRIIEVRKGNKIHYEIQELKWFIFSYWDTLSAFQFDEFNSCADYLLKFEYIEQAEKYIKENYPESREIVKYINV